MGKVFELKYQAGPQVLQQIQAEYGDFQAITMETHYFDTPDGSLGALRWTLRQRLQNGVSICGLKTPGKNLIRGEWEVENPSMAAGLQALCRMDVPEGFEEMVKKGIGEVCGARFTRLAKIVPTADGTVEIALDQGVFLGGGLLEQFLEVDMIKETKVEGRRRSYILTEKGRETLEGERKRLLTQLSDYDKYFKGE